MDYFKKAMQDVTPAIKFFEKKSKQALSEIENKLINKKIPIEKQITEIIPRIYWLPFPTIQEITNLSNHLNSEYGQNYFIWNVAEHKYDIQNFNNQVVEHNFAGYPNPPLSQIFLICKAIQNWLDIDDNNVAFIHCQNTRGRSALILSCLLCLLKKFNHPGEALTYFCKQTKTKDQKILFPSQQLYLNYFANIMNGLKLNKKSAKLLRVVFSEVPQIIKKQNTQENQQQEQNNSNNNKNNQFRPYIQFFKESKTIYNSLNENKILSYNQSDISLWFECKHKQIKIKDDILIRCKHYESNKVRVPVFRMMINTNFIFDNVIRLYKKDIDFTSNVKVSDDFFIDILFQQDKPINKNPKKKSQSSASLKEDEEDDDQQKQEESKEKSENEEQEEQKVNKEEEELQKQQQEYEKQLKQKEQEDENNDNENLEYIVTQIKQQFKIDIPDYAPLISTPLQMKLSRESSAENSNGSPKGSPLSNKFSIIDHDSRKNSGQEDNEENEENQEVNIEDYEKKQKVEQFLNELHDEDDDLDVDNEEDMDDYLKSLEQNH